jgi:LssY-like putative type I secretion system component LssY
MLARSELWLARNVMLRESSLQRRFSGLIALCGLALWIAGAALRPAFGDQKIFSVTVAASQVWTDTKIDLRAGEKIRITATGTIQYPGAAASGPEGLPRGWKDLLRVPPVKDAGRGALIGRVGDFDAALPFLVGAKLEVVVPIAGRLFLGVNEQSSDTAEEGFDVKIEVLEAGSGSGIPVSGTADATAKSGSDATYVMPPERAVAALTRDVFNGIPRRIADKDGHPGDMVNFVIIGSEERLKRAFENGGWVLVDRTKADAVVHTLISTLSKDEYVEMPMSELYLFGRAQDFGFAHADPYAVVATRHHLRVWKAASEVEGETLWVGAATHDIGFEKDQRNGSVTHKIDPDIDLEREYLARTLVGSGVVTQWAHVTPENALTEAKTATGGSFHSDGRILVLVVGVGSSSGAASK